MANVKWYREENGKVVEVIDFDPTDKFHSDIVWKKDSSGSIVVNDINTIDPETNPLAIQARKDLEARLAEMNKPVEE